MSALNHGWEPMPSSVWLSVVDHLPRPLTTEQAAHDLRVYASQVRLGRRRQMPGRVMLRKRWGWTDRKVRSLLANESAWADPRTTSVPSAYHERTKPAPTTQVEPSAAYQPRTTRVPPMSTRAGLHRTQNTEHRLSTTAATPRARSADAAAPKSLIPGEVEQYLVWSTDLLHPLTTKQMRKLKRPDLIRLLLNKLSEETRDDVAAMLPVKMRNRPNLDLVERTLRINGLTWATRDKPTRGEDRTAEIREANRTLHRRAFAHIYEAGEAK